MKRQALLGLIALLVGCASHASPTTATSQPKLRDGRGVEYPKEIALGARMHIEAWGCKGAETGSIALSPPPMDLSDPRNYGPGRRHDVRIGGDAFVTVDKEGRFSTDLYIRPDGVEGRYRVTGLCFGPGDAVSPYADLEQWFDVLPKRVLPAEFRVERLTGRRVSVGSLLSVEGSNCLRYPSGAFPEAIVYVYRVDRVESFRFPTTADGSWSGTITYPFDQKDDVAILAQCAVDDPDGTLERGVISPDVLPPRSWTIRVAR